MNSVALERRLSRLQRLVVVLLIFVPFLSITLVAGVFYLQTSKGISSEVFCVVDDHGRTRAVLGYSDDVVQLSMFDADGKLRLISSVLDDEKGVATGIRLVDEKGVNRISVAFKNLPAIHFADDQERTRMSLALDKAGQPMIVLMDEKEKTRLMQSTQTSGKPGAWIGVRTFDQANNEIARWPSSQ